MKSLILLCIVIFAATATVAQTTPATLQNFRFYTLDGKPFGKEQLKPGLTTFVLFFSPDCDHCQAEAKSIKAEIAKFKNCQFVWVTWEENADLIREFQKNNISGVTTPLMNFCRDKDYKIDSWFGESTPPATFVYGKDNKLIKVFKDEIKASDLYMLIK